MSYRNLIAIVVVTVALAGLSACKDKPAAEGKKSAGQTVVEVNGTAITTADVKKEIENLPPYLKQMAESLDGKKQLVETMVTRELLLQQAKKEGLDKSQAIADKLEELKKQIIVQLYLKKKVEEQVKIGDADLQKFYDQNKEKFKTGEQVRASHILVKTEPEAKDILAKLKGGASFEELAKKSSIDTGAGAKGGDLGWFGKGSMLPDFEKVAFGLKEGELSGIVKTKFGYHIIKVTGKRPAGIRPFAEVKDQLRDALLPEKQQEVFAKIQEDLKKNVKYTTNEAALKSIETAPAGGKLPAVPAPAANK